MIWGPTKLGLAYGGQPKLLVRWWKQWCLCEGWGWKVGKLKECRAFQVWGAAHAAQRMLSSAHAPRASHAPHASPAPHATHAPHAGPSPDLHSAVSSPNILSSAITTAIAGAGEISFVWKKGKDGQGGGRCPRAGEIYLVWECEGARGGREIEGREERVGCRAGATVVKAGETTFLFGRREVGARRRGKRKGRRRRGGER